MEMAEAEAAAAQGGWSSLPADLVNRVADCLLATNDLDCYMDLRGVCHNWRAATADPRSNPRFHPTRWIMLDEHESSTSRFYRDTKTFQRMFQAPLDEDGFPNPTGHVFSSCVNMFDGGDGVRLFVNADTGRFLRRKLPLLRDYHFVASTTAGGFLVLADTAAPHAVRVLNPFTGALLRFKAPAPPESSMTAGVVVVQGGLLTLVLAAIRNPDGCSIYLADPRSEQFVVETTMPWGAVISSSEAEAAFGLLGPVMRSRVLPQLHRGLAAELSPGGEIVRVDGWSLRQRQEGPQGVRVFRLLLDSAGRPAMEQQQEEEDSVGRTDEQQQQVTSIGGRALFVGARRCFSVDAASFPSIQPDCVYYYKAQVESLNSDDIDVYDLAQRKEERIAEASIYPAPIVQLLVEYAMHAPSFEPSSDHSMRAWKTNAATPYYPVQTELELLLQDADVIQAMRLDLS